ncbi:MAG: sodium:calcium antiporter [Methanothrix sp.]|nr:MAG: sodium:calcium antiporter [Methanothrix sp.]
MEFLIFAVSMLALYYGAKFITDSAVHFAKVLGISEFVIGATVIAFGTSFPELSTSATAMLTDGGYPEVAVGNVLGSNLANIGLALGAAGMLYSIYIDRDVLENDLSLLLAPIMAVFVVLLDLKVTGVEGLFLIFMYLSFVYHEISQHRKNDVVSSESLKPRYPMIFLTGMVLLYLGAKYLIASILDIAVTLGIDAAVVSFILVALGTSLPEVSTAIVAAKNGRGDIAIGTVIGSNAFNVLIVLGAISFMGDVMVSETFIYAALPAVVLISVLLGFMVLGNKITRFEGSLLVAIYFLTILNTL